MSRRFIDLSIFLENDVASEEEPSEAQLKLSLPG